MRNICDVLALAAVFVGVLAYVVLYVVPHPHTVAAVTARYCASDVGLFVPCVFSTDQWSI